MVEMKAGVRYRVTDTIINFAEEGVAAPYFGDGGVLRGFDVHGWFVQPDGSVTGCPEVVVEEVGADEPQPTEPETLQQRHEADLHDLAHDGVPRLDKTALRVRHVHALERIAEALEVLTSVAMDHADAMAPDVTDSEDEETVQ